MEKALSALEAVADLAQQHHFFRRSSRLGGRLGAAQAVHLLNHGARPDLGKNAISQLMEFLGTLHLANEEAAEFIEFYNQYIGYEIHGESLGISQEDQLSGPTTVTVGLLEMNQEAVPAKQRGLYRLIRPL